ncbi:bifunctional dihydrofolate reductase-thymidylate synthase [Babesia caballi]|uniref:Bifunctional dihydrofolate reductase-thymidylate synthase n=1 Tax=Babesia caballi TaxID=5871 RepID=A0AAV4LZD2_BABCB|nr:bifunctional dihydrofolate reductase-thymidylate synthase [Babesia caballi]
MAKLTRVLKKILLKDAPDPGAKKAEAPPPPSLESLATRRLPQPTVDFGNLPIIDDSELRMRAAERERIKSLVKVSRKGAGIAKERASTSKFKTNVVRPKLKGATAASAAASSDCATEPLEAPRSPAKPQAAARTAQTKSKSKSPAPTASAKVIKSGAKSDSRGKRKREARKEMWRRKYDFSNEAKRLVAAFQQEDEHGPALGNLSGLKDQLTSLEDLLKSAPPAARPPTKPSQKRLLRTKLRNKALLQAAMDST